MPILVLDGEVIQLEDTYSWSNSSSISIDDFLARYKPSMVENDGTKPWLWVHSKREGSLGSGTPSSENQAEALMEAAKLLEEVTKKVEDIKNDPAIPARSSKKTGAKGKKELREEVQKEYTAKLKTVSQKYGYVNGKWLLFAPSDKVDMIWSKLAKSVCVGPLSKLTPIATAKVSTSPKDFVPNYQHVICLYIPDVYDLDSVRETMKVLLRNHGCNLSGVKSDLYTLAGIDSKHPSGLQSTIWKNTDILKESEIKQLKESFFAEMDSLKEDDKRKREADSPKKTPKRAKAKPKAPNDPFGSDSETEDSDTGEPSAEEKRRLEKLNEVTKKKTGGGDESTLSIDEECVDEDDSAEKEMEEKRSKKLKRISRQEDGTSSEVSKRRKH